MPPAAHITHQVTHSSALNGLLLGVAIGAAVVLASVSTGGLALGALALGGASLGGSIGQFIGSYIILPTGPIIGGNTSQVLIRGKPAAAATDLVMCAGPPGRGPHFSVLIAQGSETVLIGGLPVARLGDKVVCGATIGEGEDSVLIGGPTITLLDIEEEVPEWLEWLLIISGLIQIVGVVKGVATSLPKIVGKAGGWLKMLSLGNAAVKGGGAAYKIALAGGKHSGWLKTMSKLPTKSLQKSILSMKSNILKHQNLIRNPVKYMQKYNKGNWGRLDPRQQQYLQNVKWPNDIKRAKEQIDILIGILKTR